MKNLCTLFISILLFNAVAFSQTWEDLDSSTDYILFDISFPPGQNQVGYAAGMQYTYDAEGVIVKTTDGGDSWTQIVGGPNTIGFEAICFTSPDTGYVAGWDGYFAKTTDGGATWSNMSAGFDNWFFMDIEFYDANNGIALANLNSGASGVYVTNNAGESWTASLGINQNIQDLAYASGSVVYAVGGDEKISRSLDGGNSFTEIYSGTIQRYFIGCDFNGSFGVIGGEDGKIFSTNDGGISWDTYATGYHNFQGVHVFDADSAYIGGTDEDVYKSLDEGENWEMEDGGSGTSHIYKIKFTSDGTGFLCGSQGLIRRKEAPVMPLVAMFEAGETDICAEDQLVFTDLSTGNIESWEWFFEGGDPETSNEQNPVVTYSTPGIYDVSLTISNATDENTMLIEDYITVHNCAGTEEVNNKSFRIYPNPANDLLYLRDVENGARVRILDLAGKVVYNKVVNTPIDLSNIAEGSYLVEVEIQGHLKQQKLIINR